MRTKRLFSIIFTLAAVLMISCTKQDTVTGTEVDGTTRMLTFNVSADGGAHTRATSATAPSVAGYKMQYVLQVLDASGNSVNLGSGTQVSNETGTFTVDLPVGVTYTCLFWAQYIPDGGGDNAYFNTGDLEAVALKQHLSADDQCQAFCATADVAADQASATTTVTLTRAVAQVNLKSNESLDYFDKMEATYADVPNTFNVKDNLVSIASSGIAAPSTFSITAKPAVGVDGKFTYHTVYFLARGDGNANLLKIKLETFNTGDPTPIQTLTINDVPTKKNYKTNVTTMLDPASFITNYTFDFAEWETAELATRPVSKWDGVAVTANTASNFGGGDGSESDPYIIDNAANFALFAANVNSGETYQQKHFELTIDIDLQNHPWTPIGLYINDSDKKAFKGHFNGNQHRVINLKIDSDALRCAGLFGCVQGRNYAIIEKLHVQGNVKNKYAAPANLIGAAGIVPYLDSDATIASCSFSGTVECTYGYAGGLAAAHNGDCAIIVASKNTGNITGKTVGGIIGGPGVVIGCCNTGTIHGTERAGGLCGDLTNALTDMAGCYNIGAVSCDVGSAVGALSGNDDSRVSGDCYVSQSYAVVAATYEKVFGNGSWPDGSITGDAWHADPSNNGTFTKDGNGEPNGNYKFWKSIGSWNGGNPVYPKLWWEE